jgi:basic endochitinase B
MKHYTLAIFFLIFLSATGNAYANDAVTDVLNAEQYQKLFPHHALLYSYENFVAAAKSFPKFATQGDRSLRLKELAAFFANIAHETTSGWSDANGGPYVWGLFYVEEVACKDGHCIQYNTAGYSRFLPVAGKSYHGRGPMQITYAYNYGLAGADLNLPLLQHPELVSTDGVIAFKTALWLWMRAQSPKPSCHDVMCGVWKPSVKDIKAHRQPGFGMVINIINGGIECNALDKDIRYNRNERIGFYKRFAEILGITVEDNCDCAGMITY